MFSSDAFSSVNLLDRAADASWTRESVISNNIANVDTPNYKRQDVEFSDILEKELRATGKLTAEEAVKAVDSTELDSTIYTDYPNYSYRLDGNNVDVDTENVELASEQIRYSALTTGISAEFNRFKAVIS